MKQNIPQYKNITKKINENGEIVEEEKVLKISRAEIVPKKKTFVERALNKRGYYKEQTEKYTPTAPVLFLMRNDMQIDVIDNIEPGELRIPPLTKDGEEKLQMITPEQMYTIRGTNIKVITSHEDHPLPFPYAPEQTSRMLLGIVMKLIANQGLLKDDLARGKLFNRKMVLIIGGVVLVLGVIAAIYQTGMFGNGTEATVVTTVTETAKAVIQ